LHDLRRAYLQDASARQDSLGRVLGRLLQHEAQSARVTLSPTILQLPQERKPHMGHPISGSPRQRRSLSQRLGLLAATALLILLVGSMAVTINLAYQHKENTAGQATKKAASTTIPIIQQNLYITFGTTVEKLDSRNGNVLWTYTTPDLASSPVTIAGGVVYVAPQNSPIYALNATNGKLLWQTDKHFGGSVVVVQNIVYARNLDTGYLYALDASNGQILWQRQLGFPVAGLVVAEGSIYVTATIESPSTPTYAVLYALKASNGTEIWHTTFSNQFLVNTPQIVNGVLYTDSSADNKSANPPDRHSYVYAFDAKTGVMRWRSVEIKALVNVSPTVANNMVYVGSNVLGADGPAIYAFRASDGFLVWKKSVSHSVDSWLQVVNGVLYTVEGSRTFVETPVLALNASNGAVLWSHPLAKYFEFEYRGCAISNGLLYITTLDGLIHVLRTTDGTQVRSFSLGHASFSTIPPPAMVLAP
ncbi:MAG TPA: PQQ-binding-like beta-propeller repeat protein, partial [Ktedonobacteraceae bacterium]|nr:PQQ-binding-like beta-propeller repeat protein [Ktedonobacteraceae bacterium]